MRLLLSVCVGLALVGYIVSPPVTKPPPKEKAEEEDPNAVKEDPLGLEYERYLKEVVNVLETDEDFRKKLESANISDIKSGDIANHLDLVASGIRTKLDELKRAEMERLRNIVRARLHTENDSKRDPGLKDFDIERLVAHLDHKNTDSFEKEDLAKLIKQATQDLEDIDHKRREEFKKYEMEKEHLEREKMKGMDDAAKIEEKKRIEELEKKHKEHPKLNHPGSKDQLEEVWEEGDGMDKKDFNPKTFFYLHDSNGDGYLDEEEIEALFQKELDKAYDPNLPEDDMNERYEDMNRMREHVFTEIDEDQDKMISYDEFIKGTKRDDFDNDEEWKTIDDEEEYTEEELAAFEKEYEERRGGGDELVYEEHAQPGEVNVPHAPEPSHNPPEGVNHMDQGAQQPGAPQQIHPQAQIKIQQQAQGGQPPQNQEPVPAQPGQDPNHEAPAAEIKLNVGQEQIVQGQAQPDQGHGQPGDQGGAQAPGQNPDQPQVQQQP